MDENRDLIVAQLASVQAAVLPFAIVLVAIFCATTAYKIANGDENASLGKIIVGSFLLMPIMLVGNLNWWPVVTAIGVAAAIFSGWLGFEFLRAKRVENLEFMRIAHEDIDACEAELLLKETDSAIHDDAFWQIEIARIDLKKRLSEKQKRNARRLVVKLCESLGIESKLAKHSLDQDEDALQLALIEEKVALNNLIARFERHEHEKEAANILQHLRNIAAAVETLRTPKQARLLDRAEAWLDAFESTKHPKLTLSRKAKQ